MIRSWARLAHPFAAGLFVACAVVQVFLAGLGVFDDPKAFLTHRDVGYVFGWLTLLILVLALVGRMPRRVTGLSVLILVLFALQSVFVALRPTMPAVAALHPLNGFSILAVAWITARASWAVRRERAPGATADAGPTFASTTEPG